LIGFVTGESIG